MIAAPVTHRRLLLLTVAGLLVLLAVDATSLDMALARLVGGPEGFALREHWLLTRVLHDGARWVSWLLACLLTLGVWWPVGLLRRLTQEQRVQLVVTALVAAFAVAATKRFSASSCPWDLSMFGGFARYASHWSGLPDGGSGHCFPAGHASTGFSFIGGYFVFRGTSPRIARTWLLSSIAAGLLLGVAQQLRGAHFMSHTLWTGFICWCIALGMDLGRAWIPAGQEALQ